MRYEKYGTAGQPTDNSFWLTKATNTHLEYVILICTATMVTRTSLNVTLPDLFLISLGCRDVIPGSYHLESCLEGVQKTRKNPKHYSRSRDSNFSAILANWRSTGSLTAQREPKSDVRRKHSNVTWHSHTTGCLLRFLRVRLSRWLTKQRERESESVWEGGGRETVYLGYNIIRWVTLNSFFTTPARTYVGVPALHSLSLCLIHPCSILSAPPFTFHHHHHVHEGLGVFPVPWSSKWSWSLHLFFGLPMFRRPLGLYCSSCFGIPFLSILCTCCSHFFWYCFISFTMFCAPVFFP